MSDCVGAPGIPVCRENYPFVYSTIKSPDNVPIEFAIENGASVRIAFLNYQSQKHKHQRSRSRQHVFTALLDNVRDHRAGTSDHPFQKHAQARLRVHHIVIMRVPESGQSTNTLGHAAVEMHSVQECLCSHNQLIRATLQVSVFGRSDFHYRFHLRLF